MTKTPEAMTLALIALTAWSAWSQTPTPILPLRGITPGGAPVLLEATAPASGPVTTRLVKTDSTILRTTAGDGSILLTAVPQPPAPNVINRVLWIPLTLATTQPPAQQIWCLSTGVVPSWSPVAIVESRITSTGVPVSFDMFYLIQFPSQSQGSPTAEGLTWFRNNSSCAGGAAIAYTPASLPSGDQRVQVFAMVIG